MRSITLGLATVLTLAVLAPASTVAGSASSSASGVRSRTVAGNAASKGVPALHVRKIVTGLDIPWDVKPIGHGRLLFTQRDRATLSVWRNGHQHRVRFPSKRVWVSGTGNGLMALEVDPAFARNGRFYTCQGGFTPGGGHVMRVLAWHLNDRATRSRMLKPLVGRLPADNGGTHVGCRLLIPRDGSLLVGTGDAAHATNPEDLTSLAGKTLRLNRFTGKPWPTNPFIHAHNRHKRYVQTYGHRNIQGLAQRRDGTLWQVEHGPDRDDEVNKLVNGGDYGFNPVFPDGPGYNEFVPMTDQSLPGKQVAARWRSGFPTLATSGCAFVRGKKWGALNGTLAVAALKASRMIFLTFDASGHLRKVRDPKALHRFGRLRSVTVAPNDDLLVTTSNEDGKDAILEISPR